MKVLYLDRENGWRRLSRRIKALGGDAALWKADFFYCFNPKMDQTDNAKKAFGDTLDQIVPDLVIFDSFAGFLGGMQLDENKSQDVTAWSEAYLKQVRDREITTLIIDHTPRGENRSRGSMRKSEEADVNLYLDTEGSFDPNTTTTVTVERLSDRDGALPPKSTYKIGGDGQGGFIFDKVKANRLGLSTMKLRMFEVLEKSGPDGMTYTEWTGAAEDTGMKISTAKSAIAYLKDYKPNGSHIIKQEDSKYCSNVADLDALDREKEAS